MKDLNRKKTTVVNLRIEGYDVFIGRPTIYGNPFIIGKDGTREEVIEKFRCYLKKDPELINTIRNKLHGRILGCYCKPALCHGDIIAKVADGGEP